MDMKLIAAYGFIHWVAYEWQKRTEPGRKFRKFCAEWQTDWVHGVCVSVTVFIWGMVSILVLGLALHKAHI